MVVKQSDTMAPINTITTALGFATPAPLVSAQQGNTHALTSTCPQSGGRTLSVASATAPGSTSASPPPSALSRRSFAALFASVAALPLVPSAARADAALGQLVLYRDLPKGFLIFRPNGWNEFEGMQDNYDIKWQDVIQPLEFITVLTSPVAKDKKLKDLGDPQTIGTKLAKSRSGQLTSAVEKDIDGVPAYVFEIKREQSRQVTLLTINKMKLYSVNASCPERRWSKRQTLMRSVVDSFKPRL